MIRSGVLFRVWMAAVTAMLALSCNVFEVPETDGNEPFVLKLDFETDFTLWNYTYNGSMIEKGIQTGAAGTVGSGLMHYVVRACPKVNGTAQHQTYEEFEFVRDAASGYDCEFMLNLTPGEYEVLVWSELSPTDSGEYLYDASDFGKITLAEGPHAANTDYRDAFRGKADILVRSYMRRHATDRSVVKMERPLAKYEFVMTDLPKFLSKNGGTAEDYESVVYYTDEAHMSTAYSIYTDKPVESVTGVRYVSAIRSLDASEASLGFDYMFVNGTQGLVTLKVEIRRKADGEVVSRTNTVRVPLLRGRCTVIRGSFISTSSGGVGVDPGFEDDINYEI